MQWLVTGAHDTGEYVIRVTRHSSLVVSLLGNVIFINYSYDLLNSHKSLHILLRILGALENLAAFRKLCSCKPQSKVSETDEFAWHS